MKPETKLIVNSLSIADIFPPRELDFIAVAIDFWRSDDGMKNWETISRFISPLRKGVRGILLGKVLQDVMKCLFHLSLLDPKLIFIADREPLRSSIELVTGFEWDFERGFFYHIDLLTFVVRLTSLEHSDMNDTPRDTSSRDYNFATVGCDTESLPSEDEFIDSDVFEYFVFWHKKSALK